jgi:hypothetical protein
MKYITILLVILVVALSACSTVEVTPDEIDAVINSDPVVVDEAAIADEIATETTETIVADADFVSDDETDIGELI